MNTSNDKANQKRRLHDVKMQAAYDAGYNDGRQGNTYRCTPIECICKACGQIYRVGYETGTAEAKAKDD